MEVIICMTSSSCKKSLTNYGFHKLFLKYIVYKNVKKNVIMHFFFYLNFGLEHDSTISNLNSLHYDLRPKKKICVFTVTCQKNLGSVGWH